MSEETEKSEVESLFDLDYHETAIVQTDKTHNRIVTVIRVPNGWVYISATPNGETSVFVPEYIPTPPPEKEETDLLDAEICDFLNALLSVQTKDSNLDSITANRLLRAIEKRNRAKEL